MPKVSELIDPSFKSGISKTGKPWSLAKIRTDNNEEATIFNPVKVGDEVTLTYNADYKNYNAELVKPKTQASAQLDRIEAKVDQILFQVNGADGKKSPVVTANTLDLDNVPPPESYDGQSPF